MASNGIPRQQDRERAVLLLRVAPALKSRLAAYARARGLTLNAASIILLDQALDAQEAGTEITGTRTG